jgi:hypothetical protein
VSAPARNRRAEDKGWLCWIAARASEVWDFIDERQIIRRFAFIWTLAFTGRFAIWTMDYAWHSNQSGSEIAFVIAAVWAPWTAFQAAIFKFYDQAQQANGIEQSAKQRAAA